MASVKVCNNQSLFDIAIQKCGSIEAAYDIAILNGLSITDELTAGQVLNLPTVVNSNIADYYESKGIAPATAVTAADLIFEGIDYWGIDVDFIVQ